MPVLPGHRRGGALHPRAGPAAVRDARRPRATRPSPTAGAPPRSATPSTCAWPARAASRDCPVGRRHGHVQGRVPVPPLRRHGCGPRRTTPWAGCRVWARLSAPGPAAGQRALQAPGLARAGKRLAGVDAAPPGTGVRRGVASCSGGRPRAVRRAGSRRSADRRAVARHVHAPTSTRRSRSRRYVSWRTPASASPYPPEPCAAASPGSPPASWPSRRKSCAARSTPCAPTSRPAPRSSGSNPPAPRCSAPTRPN